MELNFMMYPEGRHIEVAPPFRVKVSSRKKYLEYARKNMLGDFFVSVYSFKDPFNYETAVVDKVFWDVDERSGEAMRLLNSYYSEYERVFVATGNNFHMYVAIEKLDEYKKPSLYAHISDVEKELGVRNDPATKGNLAQMGRVPGSVNTKNGNVCLYFDPYEWSYSKSPVVLRGKKLKLEKVEYESLDKGHILVCQQLSSSVIMDFDSDALFDALKRKYGKLEDPGHFSRMNMLRRLRNEGVPPTVARRYMYWSLPPNKVRAMEQEKMIERIYSFKI